MQKAAVYFFIQINASSCESTFSFLGWLTKNFFSMKCLLIHFCIHLFMVSSINAQDQQTDSLLGSKAFDKAVAVYINSIHGNSSLYNGRMYPGYLVKLRGIPFFKTDKFNNGDLILNGMLYKDLPLMYDIIKDVVILQHYNKVQKIQLPSEDVDRFSFSGHTFTRIEKDSALRNVPPAGFYELMYEGQVQLLAKRKKSLQEVRLDRVVEYEVIEKNRYFIKKGSSYYAVKSPGSVLRVFKDRKKELAKILKAAETDQSKNRESILLFLAREYDKLSKP